MACGPESDRASRGCIEFGNSSPRSKPTSLGLRLARSVSKRAGRGRGSAQQAHPGLISAILPAFWVTQLT
jgi:hypothetical protein